MAKRTQTLVLIVLLANLAVIAVAGYALDYGRVPTGVLFVTKGGPVPFSHRVHVQHGSDDLRCRSCHHDIKGRENTKMNCRGCHYYGRDPHRSEKEKIHKRCIGAKCVSCHADEQCSYCHSQ